VAVERLLDFSFKIFPHDGGAFQVLHQHRRGIDKARGAVATLEGKVLNESLLDRREPHHVPLRIALCMALDRAQRFAGKVMRGRDAG
jgi:hypothetical protein